MKSVKSCKKGNVNDTCKEKKIVNKDEKSCEKETSMMKINKRKE